MVLIALALGLVISYVRGCFSSNGCEGLIELFSEGGEAVALSSCFEGKVGVVDGGKENIIP